MPRKIAAKSAQVSDVLSNLVEAFNQKMKRIHMNQKLSEPGYVRVMYPETYKLLKDLENEVEEKEHIDLNEDEDDMKLNQLDKLEWWEEYQPYTYLV